MKKLITKSHPFIKTLFLTIIYASLANIAVAADAPKKPSTLRTISINSNIWITIAPSFEPYKGDAPAGVTDTLKNLAESNDINLRNIVLKAFRTRLEQSDVPTTLVTANAEADLQIHIEDYGLTARNKTLMQPTITIEARLIKANGHVIWNAGENLSDSEIEGISAQTWQDYIAKPAALKTGYEEIANAAVKSIVSNLIESHKTGEIGE